MAATLVGELSALMDMLQSESNEIVAHLGKNSIPSASETILPTDLVECDFPGYASMRLTEFSPVFLDDDNYGEADSGEVEWKAGNLVTPQTITCVWITQKIGDQAATVWQVIVLKEPITMLNPGDLFWFSFRFQSANVDVLPGVGEDA